MPTIPALLDPKHYNECIAKGRQLCEKLETLEDTNPPDGPSLGAYDILRGTLSCPDRQLRTGLADLGIGAQFEWVEVRSDSGQENPIYSNWFSRSTIIAGENFKLRDEKPDPKIFASEALWKSFLLSQEHVPSQGHPVPLKTVVRSSVINASSRTAIWHAARRSTCTNVGQRGYRVYTNTDDGFWAILGSTNGASTVRMLKDHKTEIGFRTIEKVVVFECLADGDVFEKLKARSFAVLLSD